MALRWGLLAFLFASLFVCSATAATIQVLHEVKSWAIVAEDQTPIMDRIVPVPPWNRTEESGLPYGWVGFNISLPKQGKAGYEAGGVILPNNLTEKPAVVMRIVNETGFDLLIFDQFSEFAWNASKVYAVAYLDSTHQYDQFGFIDLDNASKYCVFFRGIDNGTKDFEILISIKETWFEVGEQPPDLEINDSVYVIGDGFPPATNVTIFIIPDNMSVSPSNAVSSSWAITDPDGRLSATLVWQASLTEGLYDVWVDINQNSVYEQDVDLCIDLSSSIYAFNVVSRFEVGDVVWATADLHVRYGPGLNYTIVATMLKGNKGLILSGPLNADGYNWWNVNYSVGVTGWSAEDWLELAPPPPQSPRDFSSWAEAGISWAEQRIGSEKWWNYCMRFVANAFMQEEGKEAGWNAIDAAREFYRFNQEPYGWLHAPKGAILFFDEEGTNAYGHVGIYLGNGSLIHAYRTVKVNTIEEVIAKPDVGQYLGWSYPHEVWRPTKFTFNATWEGVNYPVVVFSNSTVTGFVFNQSSLTQISFEVSDETGTVGYCNVTIPKNLTWCDSPNEWKVTVDGEAPITFPTPIENGTHTHSYTSHISIVRIKLS